MVHRYRAGVVPYAGKAPAADPGAGRLLAACEQAPGLIDAALDGFDFRAATDTAWHIVDQANRHIEDIKPWHQARTEHDDPSAAPRLDAALNVLVQACRCLATELTPFIPATAAKVAAQCTPSAPSGRLPDPEPVFPRLSAA